MTTTPQEARAAVQGEGQGMSDCSGIVVWTVFHRDDTPDTLPKLYGSRGDAEKHAAQFAPGVARVVALGDVDAAVAAERERCNRCNIA